MQQTEFGFPELKEYKMLEVIHSLGRVLVYINGIIKYDFEECDKVTLRFVAVQLYKQWKINQQLIAEYFNITPRTLFNWISSYNEYGAAGLEDKPRGAPVKITDDVKARVIRLRKEGEIITEISRKMGLSRGKVWTIINAGSQSGNAKLPGFAERVEAVEESSVSKVEEIGLAEELMNDIPGDNPDGLSEESEIGTAVAEEVFETVFDDDQELFNSTVNTDPLDRSLDRMSAVLGFIDDAKPIFANVPRTEFVGVFLAVAVLSKDIFFPKLKQVYISMGPAFYGLRNTFMMLFIMAFLRIKNPEKSDQYNKTVLGRLLGLDRAPAVKTVRRKIKFLTCRNKASVLMDILAKERLDSTCEPAAVLYVDGHVISYYGKRKLGKTFSTSKNKVTSASTEYWVNLAYGTPILCIPTEFNSSMTVIFEKIMKNARKVCGKRQITFVFDRGGCSGALFDKIIKEGYDFIAYNKNSSPVDDKKFIEEKTIINGKEYGCKPYSREIEKEIYKRDKNGRYRKTGEEVSLREVLVKRDDGRHTSIVTSRRDLESTVVAEIIFKRWTQENYFKYLNEEYDFNHLCTYKTFNVDESIDHPNPEYTELTKKIEKLNKRIEKLVGKQLKESVENSQSDKFSEDVNTLNSGKKGKELANLRKALKFTREAIKNVEPRISASEYERIDSESRLVTNIVKMTAYYIEGKLAKMLSHHYKGINGNERGIISAMLKSSGSINVNENQLIIGIEEQATPDRTRMLKAVCSEINALGTVFPGTKLEMLFQLAE